MNNIYVTRTDPDIFHVVAVVLSMTADAPAANVLVPVVLSLLNVIVSVVIASDQVTELSFSIPIIVPMTKGTDAFAGIVIVCATVLPVVRIILSASPSTK